MADKLTTSKTLAGETDAEAEESSALTEGEVPQADIDAARDAAGGVGDATDWNHTEGEADPLVDPYAESNALQAKNDAAAKEQAEADAADKAEAEAKAAAEADKAAAKKSGG